MVSRNRTKRCKIWILKAAGVDRQPEDLCTGQIDSLSNRGAPRSAMWQYDGKKRPDFAVNPKAGEESVWDYPRPPRIEDDGREVIVRSPEGELVARSSSAKRLCETASPPQFYLPRSDVVLSLLMLTSGDSFCEWKGRALSLIHI